MESHEDVEVIQTSDEPVHEPEQSVGIGRALGFPVVEIA